MITKKIRQWFRTKKVHEEREEVLEITFRVGGFGIANESKLTFFPNGTAVRSIDRQEYELQPGDTFVRYKEAEAQGVYAAFIALGTEEWPSTFEDEDEWLTRDGTQWSLTITQPDSTTRTYDGSNAYPDNWEDVIKLFGIS
ncbi:MULTISPECIES: hypothetical protein [unclassified Exiguobacterium]|jgi:hypothetical protein|uniref:hypothetical protein n=1 Tax=unclassified Exiguobacterium TaxID=2644629 RepID=UPI001BEA620B|nr:MULTISPECIES: hypothetical protein [unclassified Exiguobacterium]